MRPPYGTCAPNADFLSQRRRDDRLRDGQGIRRRTFHPSRLEFGAAGYPAPLRCTEVHEAAGPAVRVDVPDLRVRKNLEEIRFDQVQVGPEAIQVRRRGLRRCHLPMMPHTSDNLFLCRPGPLLRYYFPHEPTAVSAACHGARRCTRSGTPRTPGCVCITPTAGSSVCTEHQIRRPTASLGAYYRTHVRR